MRKALIVGMHIKKNDKGAVPPELKGKKNNFVELE